MGTSFPPPPPRFIHCCIFRRKRRTFRRLFRLPGRHCGQRYVHVFTIDDLGQTSTFRELKAIYYVLLSLVEHLKHKRVKIFTDNQSAARVVSVGSSEVHLQSVTLSIFRFCFSHGIALEAGDLLDIHAGWRCESTKHTYIKHGLSELKELSI